MRRWRSSDYRFGVTLSVGRSTAAACGQFWRAAGELWLDWYR